MNDNVLQIVISALDKTKEAFGSVQKQMSGLTTGAKGLQDKLKAMQPTFKTMAIAGGAAFAAIAGEATMAIKAFSESEAQLKQVDAIIQTFSEDTLRGYCGATYNSQEAMKAARAEILDFGQQMQALGGISDEVASIGLAKLTQITGNVGDAMHAASVAADLSIYKNIDYASAVDIVGKVLSGNTSILTRYGIQLKDNATIEEAMAELARRTAGQYEAYGKTLAGQTEILKQTFGDLQETIGATLAPILTDLLKRITPVLNKVMDWIKANPELTKNIIIVSGAVAGLVAVLGTFGLVLPKIIGGFLGIVKAVQGVGAAFSWLAVGPHALIIAAIVAIIVVIVLLVKHWDTIKAKTIEVWTAISTWITNVVNTIVGTLTGWWNNVVSIFQTVWYFILGMVELFKIALTPIWQPMVDATTMVFGWLGEQWNILKENAILFWTILKDKLVKIWTIFSDNFKLIWNGIKDFFQGIWDSIYGIFQKAIDKLLRVLEPFFNAYQRLQTMAASVGAYIGEQVGAIIEIGKGGLKGSKQTGGYIPETGAYLLHRGEYVMPKSKAGGIIINITGNTFMSDREAAEKIGDMIVDKLKMQFSF